MSFSLAICFYASVHFTAAIAASCCSPVSGLIGWWPADGNANDLIQANNGSLQGGATASAAGEVNTAFSFDGTNAFVQIANSATLRPTNLTIEAWVRFSGLDSAGSGGSPAGDQYIVFRQNTRSSDFEGFDLSKTRVSGSDVFRFLISSASGQAVELHSSTVIAAGVWYHVAGVRGTNFIQLFVNGNLERQTNISFPQDYGNFPLYFGTSGQSFWDHKLKGNLDEVSLYDRALSATEIAAIYNAASAGKCKGPAITSQPQSQTVAPGSNPTFAVSASGLNTPGYQWRLNGVPIPGATGTSLSLTNVQISDVGNYSVLVTNSMGATLSANAALSLCRVLAWGNSQYGQTNLPPGLTNVVAVSAGVNHAISLTGDGRVVGWGNDTVGEIDAPSTLTNAMAISAGLAHNIALQSNGIVVAWGDNFHGKGVSPPGLSNVVAISAGYDHNLALKSDGTVTAWGDNFWGQSDVPADLSNVVAIAAGGFHSLALKSDGTVVAWGSNINGQSEPPPDLRGVVAISAGEWFSAALRSDGSVVGWGDNGAGELNVPAGLSNLVSIAAGNYFTLGLKTDGSVLEWSENSYGEANVPTSATNITAISASGGFGLALMNFGPLTILRQPASQSVYSGQTAFISAAAAGVSPLSYQWQFNGVNIPGATSSLLAISNVQSPNAGNYRVVISNPAGTITSAVASLSVLHAGPFVFAQPLTQQALLGTTASWSVSADGSFPISYQWKFNGANIPGATSSTLTLSNLQFANAGNYTVAVTNAFGSITSTNAQLCITPIAAWGDDGSGQTDVPFGLSNVVAVAGGSSHSLALKSDGTVAAWGYNGGGATTVPTNLANVVAIAAGNGYSMALKSDGTITSWGSAPTAPAGLNNVIAIAAGDYHSLALIGNGTVTGWGNNTYGQINVPSGLSNVVAISAGSWNSLALKTDGTVVVWGADINGDTDTPPGATNIEAIAQGGVHNLALRRDGMLVPWGDNTYGENTPPAGISNNIVAVATGLWHNLALRNDGMPVVWGDQNFTPSFIRNAISISAGGSHNLALVNNGAPVIVNHPLNLSLNQLVASGTDVHISVPVTGAQPITYSWTFNGLPIADGGGITGSTTPSLLLANVQTNASGNYQLVASNAFGIATSFVAVLTVLDAPAITLQPTNQTTVVGSNVVIAVTATGSQPLSYSWYYNGAPFFPGPRITGTTSPTLVISNAQASDTGGYSLIATNPVGSVTSVVAQLIVWTPSAIVQQPVGRSIPPGLPVSFTASGSGSGPLSYQWQLNGSDITGATNTILTVPAVGTNDLGLYHLVVSNVGGVAVSSDALLTFGPVAAWGLNSSGQCLTPPGLSNVISIAGDSTYSLATKSDGSVVAWGTGFNVPPGLSNAVCALPDAGGAIVLLSSGAVVKNSIALPVPAAASSNVVAIASSLNHALALRAEGTVIAWSSATLTPPQAKVPPGLNHVIAIAAGLNQSLALRDDGTVVAWGFGTATNVPPGLSNVVAIATGTTNSLALKSDGTVVVWGGPYPTNLVATLTNAAFIAAGGTKAGQGQSVVVRSNGTFVVWGDNNAGQTNVPAALSNLFTISAAAGEFHDLALVNGGAPLILSPPIGGTTYSGRDYAFRTISTGLPPLTYQWFFNGAPLANATNATLTLSNIQTANTGDYQLVVSNALGVASSVLAPVTVLDGAPFFIQSPPATNFAFLGTRSSLSSVLGGSGPLHYQWLFNGQQLPGATSDSLVFARAANSNIGAYTLIVTNSFGSITSSVANLYVLSVFAWGTVDVFNNETNTPLNLTNAIAIAGGYTESMALRADGTVVAWGHYQNGETNIPSGMSNIVEIACGSGFNLALRSDGRVVGFGNAVNTNVLAGLSNIIAIEADINAATFLRSDGTLARLTGSTLTFPLTGTNVVALTHFIQGYAALRADGTIALSGSPKAGVSNVLAMSLGTSGADNEIFLKRDGTVQTSGRLIGPVGISNAIDVAANNQLGAAVRPADGTVGAWGAIGSVTNIPPGLANVAVLDCGANQLIALLTDRVFPPVLLPTALNTSALVVSSKESPQWFGQTNISHDGQHAAQSAPIDKNTASSMRALVNGPVTVRFWWKVSSEPNHDLLTFSIGGIQQTAISGEQDWQQQTYTVPAGPQMLVWTYSKDGSGSAGQDAAWVDQLEIIPFPPSITSQPVNQTVLKGTNVTISVSASGTPPLSYQWFKNGAALLGSPAGGGNPFALPSFTMTNVTRTNSGAYFVVITNTAGAITSVTAVVTVHVPQKLTQPILQSNGTFVLISGDNDGGNLFSSNVTAFHLAASSNLVDWVQVPSTITLSNGFLQIQDTNAYLFPRRFYRVFEDW